MAKARKGMQPPPVRDYWDTAIVVAACLVVALAVLKA